MRVGYVDPFSGASGDMFLGALIDAGVPLDELNRALSALAIPGARVEAELTARQGIRGTLATVAPEVGHHERSWRDVRSIIDQSALEPDVKAKSLTIFGALAQAESTVHGIPVDDVHFHEVGALDTIVDIVGTVIGLHLLGIDQLFCGPLRLGGGVISSAHGLLPVPAPATAQLLAKSGGTVAAAIPGEADAGELLTPTGAAILVTLATFGRPVMSVESIGSGFGSKELPWPNMCRLMVGIADDIPDKRVESLIVLETNVDDMNPQFVELLLERLFAAGALDAWTTSIGMKKGRPALLISALARPSDVDQLTDLLILQSTTLGVRQTPVSRVAADRQIQSVETRWGEVRVKLKIWKGRVIDLAPEYDDCAAIARTHDIAVREIWNEAYRIGEVYVGRRTGSQGTLARLDPIGPVSGRQPDP